MNWGDESNYTIISWNQTEITHTFSTAGVYTLAINGTIIGWQFNEKGDYLKIMEIQQWGCLQLGNTGSYFTGCANFNLTAIDTLNLTGTTNMYQMFRDCTGGFREELKYNLFVHDSNIKLTWNYQRWQM